MAIKTEHSMVSRGDSRIQRALDEAFRGVDTALSAYVRLQRAGNVDKGNVAFACSQLRTCLKALDQVRALGPPEVITGSPNTSARDGKFEPWSSVVAGRKKRRSEEKKKRSAKTTGKARIARIPRREHTS